MMRPDPQLKWRKPERILAIDPGTRELGIAVLEEGENLLYYVVRTMARRAWQGSVPLKVKTGLRSLIKRHTPTLVTIEQPRQTWRTELVGVVEEIRHAVREAQLELIEVEWREVKRLIAGNAQATKRQVADHLAQRFPELARYRKIPHVFSEKYWQRMFDAVAIAVAAANGTLT